MTSSVEENGRQYACDGEIVTFTCQIIRSFSLQWDSPLITPISFTSDPVNTMSSMSPFTTTLTSTAGSGFNRNLTSTLQVTALSSFGRSDTTVVCRNQLRVNQTSRFTVAGMYFCQTKSQYLQIINNRVKNCTHSNLKCTNETFSVPM